MPSNNQMRARARRSVSTEGTESHQTALGIASSALVEGMEVIAQRAREGDPDAMAMIIKLSGEEFSRARSGGNDPVLKEIKEIRAAGSPKLEALWGVLYKNVPRIEVDPSRL